MAGDAGSLRKIGFQPEVCGALEECESELRDGTDALSSPLSRSSLRASPLAMAPDRGASAHRVAVPSSSIYLTNGLTRSAERAR